LREDMPGTVSTGWRKPFDPLQILKPAKMDVAIKTTTQRLPA